MGKEKHKWDQPEACPYSSDLYPPELNSHRHYSEPDSDEAIPLEQKPGLFPPQSSQASTR
jgi:hypothetical protein